MEWKMVPKVMTDEMTRAAQAALDLGEGYVETSCLDLDAAYEAAIAAAPDAPGEPAPDLPAICAEERRKVKEEAARTCERLASIFLQDGKASEASALEGAAATIRALATEGK